MPDLRTRLAEGLLKEDSKLARDAQDPQKSKLVLEMVQNLTRGYNPQQLGAIIACDEQNRQKLEKLAAELLHERIKQLA